MQGKYQLHIFPEAGHFIHEDVPEKTADVIVEFWKRNDRGSLVLPPKVGDLLRMGVGAKGAAGLGASAVGAGVHGGHGGNFNIGDGMGWGEVGAFAGAGGNADLKGGAVTVAPWAKNPPVATNGNTATPSVGIGPASSAKAVRPSGMCNLTEEQAER